VRRDLSPDPPDDAPEALKRAWPLVLRWGESDDLVRSQLVEAASDEELRSLIQGVRPLYPAVNAYLDQTGDAERAVPYGDLAQAAMEAQFEVDRRHDQDG
jgi:hypothetical protein